MSKMVNLTSHSKEILTNSLCKLCSQSAVSEQKPIRNHIDKTLRQTWQLRLLLNGEMKTNCAISDFSFCVHLHTWNQRALKSRYWKYGKSLADPMGIHTSKHSIWKPCGCLLVLLDIFEALRDYD